MLLKRILLFCIAAVVCSSALAVEVENLYQGKILVTDKTLQTRLKAHRWAIEQVLAKVAGNREVLSNRTIRNEIRLRTSNYIKSFKFITDDQGRTFLVDEFDQVQIDNLLRKVGAAIWGKRRPETIIWLVVEEGLSRQIVELQSQPQLAEALLQGADNRGLPIKLPELNAPSHPEVFTSDIWAKFDDVVAEASEFYDVEHFVMARMYFDPELNWQLEYQLQDAQGALVVQQASGQQFDIIREMINGIGDHFANVYAIKSEDLGEQEIQITLSGVNSIVDIVNAEKHLRALPPVNTVSLQNVQAQKAEFHLDLSGQGLDVIKALALLPEFEQQQIEQQPTGPKLSVEEQLEQLTQDYLDQIKSDDNAQRSLVSESQANEGAVKKLVRLKYKWQG